MPNTSDDTKPIIATDRTAFYALVRFVFSISSLGILAFADLNNPKDTIPTIVYLLIGGLNGIDIYNLVKNAKP